VLRSHTSWRSSLRPVHWLGRPTFIVIGVDGLKFYRDSSCSIFFFRQLPSELAERNWTKRVPMLGSECDLKMYVRNPGYPLLCKSGALKPPIFDEFANLTAYTFRMKHDIHNWASALETTRGLLHCLKMSWTLATNGLKLDRSFNLSSANFAFRFIATLRRQTSKRNSTKLCQLLNSKSR